MLPGAGVGGGPPKAPMLRAASGRYARGLAFLPPYLRRVVKYRQMDFE